MIRAAAVPSPSAKHPDVANALRDCRRAFWSVAIFSGIVNILMLTGPLYMLQVYDRVLASRSVPTLVALTIFLVGAYAFQGAFDLIRSRIVVRAATALDERLDTSIHAAVLRLGITSRSAGEPMQPVRDLDQIRSFLSGAGPIAIVDMPWMPIFLALCFLIHPWLGLLSAAGAIVLIALTALTEWISRKPVRAVTREAGIRGAIIEADRRNSETAVAMGMAGTLAMRWKAINVRYLGDLQTSTDVVGSFGSLTKILRMLLQSGVLGLGAYLVIKEELTAGSMIAASIMMGRALAPIEVAIAHWRSFIAARQSVARLSATLSRTTPTRVQTRLPAPRHSIEIEQATIAPPAGSTAILSNIQLRLDAGDVLGIIGPSGAGKTSLVRTLVGIWPAVRGVVRIDGAALDQWDPEQLGAHVGFVSQAIELFDGTIAENIARMGALPDSDAVLRAAKAAGAHDMILRLPAGYDTPTGESGVALSAGQRQRIALARALYGDPFLIVLDEPHANLDNSGEIALFESIRGAKLRGAIVILIAHRPSAMAICDKVLFVANGTQQAFGQRDEVLPKILARPAQPAATAHPLKIVTDKRSEQA